MSLILCVEDDPFNLELLTYNLAAQGYKTAAARTGAAALDFVKSVTPDLILLDRCLPDGDGVRLIKALRGVSRTPIIMVTVMHAEDDIVFGLDMGADDYVTKPFSVRVLMARVRAMLRFVEKRRKFERRNAKES